MSDTPITDAAVMNVDYYGAVVPASVSKTLERNIGSLVRAVKGMLKALEEVDDYPAQDAASAEAIAVLAKLRSTTRPSVGNDAERYRYLRNTPPWKAAVCAVMSGDPLTILNHEGLDAVIDAAMGNNDGVPPAAGAYHLFRCPCPECVHLVR
jgi:hypothetical protein